MPHDARRLPPTRPTSVRSGPAATTRSPTCSWRSAHSEKPYPTLQKHLREKYAGRTLTFEELLNDDYPSGDAWIESHYRWAVKGLAERDDRQAVITRKEPLTPKGRPATALKLPDTIAFL